MKELDLTTNQIGPAKNLYPRLQKAGVVAPSHRLETSWAKPSRNIFFSLIEKNLGGCAKNKIIKKMFL